MAPRTVTNVADKILVYAYGFDKAGFKMPENNIEEDGYTVEFIAYKDEKSLSDADGVIMPSGIFEDRSENASSYSHNRVTLHSDRDMLAERQRQIFKASRAVPWICFLLRCIDRTSQTDETDTDLARFFLNGYFHDVGSHDPNPHLNCKSDDFRDYITKYGIARTSFRSLKNREYSMTIIAMSDQNIVAAAINNRIFFLPIPSTKASPIDVVNVVSLSAESVLKFRKRNTVYLPPWVENIEFANEIRIRTEIAQGEKRLESLHKELIKWSDYKGILCTSGNLLASLVVKILREYFDLDVKSEEEYIEDAIIFSGSDPMLVLEIKGVSGGVKREHVNQLDSHRERRGLDSTISGLLIVNDFTNTEGLESRRLKEVDSQIQIHAQRFNVKIMRALVLLEIMMLTEGLEQTLRRVHLLKCLDAADPLIIAQHTSS